MVDGRRPAAPAELAALRAELDRVAPGLDLTGEFIEASELVRVRRRRHRGAAQSELEHR